MRVFSVRVWQMRSNVLLCRAWSADSLAAYGVDEVGALQCPPLPRGARIGEVPQAEGFERINVAAFPTLQKRLWVNPFGSIEPLPLYRRRRGDTEGDIAGSGLWFRVES